MFMSTVTRTNINQRRGNEKIIAKIVVIFTQFFQRKYTNVMYYEILLNITNFSKKKNKKKSRKFHRIKMKN